MDRKKEIKRERERERERKRERITLKHYYNYTIFTITIIHHYTLS
jgi:hypothetical protein